MLITKVRGVYIDHARGGLFLIRTEKSGSLFTTPGGEIRSEEDHIEGLRRIVLSETGFEPQEIISDPILTLKRGKQPEHEVFVYGMRLEVPADYLLQESLTYG
jgi:ADP-ribose pyrophosphatase YjhB (NUDIX family)